MKPSRVSWRLFLKGEDCRLPGDFPNSSARYDLAVVVSRPVSIFLRVLTGFFISCMPIRALLMLIALGFLLSFINASEPPVILGVLEEVPGNFAGQPDFRAVRVSFIKTGAKWQPYPSSCPDQACLKTIAAKYPPRVNWTIGFSGRSLGQITGASPREFEYYSDVGLQKITSSSIVPTKGEWSEQYGGFLQHPVFRPLIAISQPYTKDPDAWQTSRPSRETEKSLRLAFRRKVPKVSNCENEDDIVGKPWMYRDGDMEIGKAYASNYRWSVVQMVLHGYRCITQPGDDIFDQWFVVTPRGEVRFLGAGMWLVDAGDYDNDGKSEMVFSIDRYNEGGYELFYDDFKGHAVFQYNYH